MKSQWTREGRRRSREECAGFVRPRVTLLTPTRRAIVRDSIDYLSTMSSRRKCRPARIRTLWADPPIYSTRRLRPPGTHSNLPAARRLGSRVCCPNDDCRCGEAQRSLGNNTAIGQEPLHVPTAKWVVSLHPLESLLVGLAAPTTAKPRERKEKRPQPLGVYCTERDHGRVRIDETPSDSSMLAIQAFAIPGEVQW